MSRMSIALLFCVLLPCATAQSVRRKGAAAAKPKVRIPLDGFGYRSSVPGFLSQQGYTMSTVDFVDTDHLLVTFHFRKLIPRLAEDRENDQDRIVRGLLLHLPDGKVEHEAEWRTHDRSRYLWNLGHGRFLFRNRNQLFSVAPAKGRNGFEQHLLLNARAEIVVVQVSPAGDMVLVETYPERHTGDDPRDQQEEPPVTASFYQVLDGEIPGLVLRGRTTKEKPFITSYTSLGILSSEQEDNQHWGFDFHPFQAEKMELAGFTSSCKPQAEFLTNATFLATGCRGGDDRRLLGGFNLLGEAPWVITTDDQPVWSAVVSAPAAERFAMRITSVSNAGEGEEHITADEVRSQEARVYAFREGRELLRVPITPVQRAPQILALSADGTEFAVLNDDNVEVYGLPPVDEADRKQMEREAAVTQKMETALQEKNR